MNRSNHVVDFVSTAAADPDVLAIKQTLLPDQRPIHPSSLALTRAAEYGSR